MTRFYSEEQTITTVTRLTRARLSGFVQRDFLCPTQSETGPIFNAADLARIELICDLSEQFDIEGDGVAVVLSLIDQLHGVRHELRRIMAAIEAQPEDQRRAILAQLDGQDVDP